MKLKDVLSPTLKDFQQPIPPMVVVSTDSDFCQETVDRGWLTAEQMAHAASRYRLGKSRSDKCIFWMIDQQGIVRDGHIGTSWASEMLKSREPELLKDWHPQHCLFGLGTLRKDVRSKMEDGRRISDIRHQTSNIAIVESEASAVILSELFPEQLWLATCYPGNLTVENLEVLKGHHVTLFPPTDPTMSTYVTWLEVADQAHRQFALDISVSSILEDHATSEQKARKIDLVEFLFESHIDSI